jgi:signal transduction histidine kinase
MQGSGTIRVTSERTDGHVLLKVEDTGPGMPPEVVEKIFEPFYTTKKEGTGLGLYITHLIVLAHRGEIRCESEVGKGTKFIIEVPTYAGKMTRGIWRKPR